MRRVALGVIALLLFVGGVVGLYAVGGADRDGGVAASAAIRAGVLLGAIWLALPQLTKFLQRFPPWMLAATGLGVLLLIVRPRLIGYVAPLFGVLVAIHFVSRLLRPVSADGKRSRAGRDVSSSRSGPRR